LACLSGRGFCYIKKSFPRKIACLSIIKGSMQSHIQQFPQRGLGRPHQKLKQILESGETDFNSIFTEFRKTEGVYGFGDSQVKSMLATL
jgi:hypothetical protein